MVCGRPAGVGYPRFCTPSTNSALQAASGVKRAGPTAPHPGQCAPRSGPPCLQPVPWWSHLRPASRSATLRGRWSARGITRLGRRRPPCRCSASPRRRPGSGTGTCRSGSAAPPDSHGPGNIAAADAGAPSGRRPDRFVEEPHHCTFPSGVSQELMISHRQRVRLHISGQFRPARVTDRAKTGTWSGDTRRRAG